MSANPRPPNDPRTDRTYGGLFLRGIDPARMDTDGRVLLLALLVSIVIHAVVLAPIYRRHLSGIDKTMLSTDDEIVHIHRAIEDKVVDNLNGPPEMAVHGDIQATLPPPASDVVRQTLGNSAESSSEAPPKAPHVLATPITDPHAVGAGPNDPGRAGGLLDKTHIGGSGDAASQVGSPSGQGGVPGPRAELPASVTNPQALNQGVELPFSGPVNSDPKLNVNGGAMVPGPGHGKSVTGEGTGGSGTALDILADRSSVPGVAQGPPPLEPTRPNDIAGLPGRGPMPPAADSPHTDIAPPTAIAPAKLEAAEHLDNDFDYVLSVIDPAEGESGYLRVDITPRRSLHRLKTIPKDVIFLIDTSLSIPQEWVDGVIAGVGDSLSSLNPDDRFNIVLFNQNPSLLSDKGILPATDANIAKATEFLSHARAAGLTDVNQAMSRLLVRDLAADRVYNLVLISDGKPTLGVQDTRELLNLITRDNDLAASIFCVGIGDEPNHELLEFLAYRNKGYCVYAPSEKRVAPTIREMMGKLRYPIIKNVHADVAGIDSNNVFPRELPDIHQGQSFSIYGRWEKADTFTMRMAGRNGRKLVDLTFSRDLANGVRGDRKLRHDWGFWKMFSLYNDILVQGESPQLRAEIEALRKQYGLKSVY